VNAHSVICRSLLLSLVVPSLLLAGCEDLGLSKKKAKLEGTRLSVLTLEKQLEPDPEIASLEVRLPRPTTNGQWPQAGGFPNHVMQHLELPDRLKQAWTADVGAGASRYSQVMNTPIVADNRVYAMDGKSEVSAFDATTGRRVWQFDVTPKDDDSQGFGGGVAFAEGVLYVTTGFGQVVALDAASGKEVWRTSLPSPMRGAPTVSDGRVFVVTIENQLFALSAGDGQRLWDHQGIPETADLLGGASPAVEGEVVVVPYSSGELVALRVENGRVVWTDNLSATRRFDAISTLGDIRGRPVIDRGRVFAISHSGRLVSIDLRTGERAWEQEISGESSPWIAGDFVYVLSSEGDLVCLTRLDGRVRWVTSLDRYEDTEKKRGVIRWTGPVLAGDRLIVVSSNAQALSISPYTGEPLGRIELPERSYLSPVIANDALYLMTDSAELIAMR
jgi:outer membrane protein assembly factor BamB